MNIILAKHYGMCFGVRDALKATKAAATSGPTTILGQLVHNEVVTEQLNQLGVRHGHLRNPDSAETPQVVITAHGAADRDRSAWRERGFRVTDTTCPLVKKAHNALAELVLAGYHPVVIGKAAHVEVLGLTGDFPAADVVLSEAEIENLSPQAKFGVVSQTTQPTALVTQLVAHLRGRFPDSEIEFIDTVCQPTKDRQSALRDLCQQVDVVIAVGGRHSNNTHQLVKTAQSYGVRAYRIGTAEELRDEWFHGVETVGVTAGTSTLHETVQEVYEVLRAREEAYACT
ncbi:4-hydroxy-3-methylbut-2-enyl diphosphate reductase [Verrucomicrobiales bacterium]|nr:4-hydroxy-3-methylbut-2-enyl diphosphate reductase [Verrucomicrobiales bacterium]MDB4730030.1 4-hydroxy-3-methylbut-2-enyl diphosphate reductase [bacterium]